MPVLCACLIARKPVSAHVSLIPVVKKRELLLCSRRMGDGGGSDIEEGRMINPIFRLFRDHKPALFGFYCFFLFGK
jgi:hypothetical protein